MCAHAIYGVCRAHDCLIGRGESVVVLCFEPQIVSFFRDPPYAPPPPLPRLPSPSRSSPLAPLLHGPRSSCTQNKQQACSGLPESSLPRGRPPLPSILPRQTSFPPPGYEQQQPPPEFHTTRVSNHHVLQRSVKKYSKLLTGRL